MREVPKDLGDSQNRASSDVDEANTLLVSYGHCTFQVTCREGTVYY